MCNLPKEVSKKPLHAGWVTFGTPASSGMQVSSLVLMYSLNSTSSISQNPSQAFPMGLLESRLSAKVSPNVQTQEHASAIRPWLSTIYTRLKYKCTYSPICLVKIVQNVRFYPIVRTEHGMRSEVHADMWHQPFLSLQHVRIDSRLRDLWCFTDCSPLHWRL